jgi:hypothetical protein
LIPVNTITVNDPEFCDCLVAIDDKPNASCNVKFCYYRKSDVPTTPVEELKIPTLIKLTVCPICNREVDWEEVYSQSLHTF